MPDTSSGAPTRNYVILERHQFEEEDGTPGAFYFIEIHTVEARNANNALRKAWKDLQRRDEQGVMLVPIPENWWRPRPVSGQPRDEYHVEIGAPVAT